MQSRAMPRTAHDYVDYITDERGRDTPVAAKAGPPVLASPRPQRLFQNLCWLCLWMHGSFRPVLDLQPFEVGEIFVVCRRQYKPVHMSNRGDLTVDERRWSTERFKPRPLFAVPRGRSFVVSQNRKRSVHDVMEIGLERSAALACRQPPTPVGELVPDWRRNCALGTVLG